ncbi:hypothetical protein ACJIZ3_009506 [Penstemon smallii]|uniref:Uncharacterized protein n=1 Tax=Penstemon smallii TaxID=265156 RepID=A0ABD3TCQ3_9LAMI
MEENFGVITKEDLKALTSEIKEQDSLLRLKRRWLMDLPLSNIEEKRIDDRILPESLLREDDVSYEDIKSCVEIGFGAHRCGPKHQCVQEDAEIFNSCEDFKEIHFLVDDMTNKGLYSLTKLLTGGEIKFEKTKLSMKKTIKEFLPDVISDKNEISQTKLKQLYQVLKDPNNFCGSQMVLSTPSEAYYAAAVKVLDGLEDFSFGILNAMHRKLKGKRGLMPTMLPPKSVRGRDSIIKSLRKRCTKMLLELGKVGEPAELLSGALGVAGLALKLLLKRPPAVEFRKFSPEMEALHNNIAQAIWLLKDTKRVSLIELKKVQLVHDPDMKLSVRSLRVMIRKLLTEYLFECSDMDMIPDCLIETLDIINKRSRSPHHRKQSTSETNLSSQELLEEIQIEVEHVLNVSAQAKEVVLDCHSGHEFDQDFDHAYMDNFDESDTLFISDDDNEQSGDSRFHSHNLTESIGETNHAEFNSPVSPSERDGSAPLLSPMERLNVNSPTCKESEVLDGQSMARKQNPLGCENIGLTNSNPVKVKIEQNLSSLSHSHNTNLSHDDSKREETVNCSSAAPKVEYSNFPVEETNLVSQQSRFHNQYLEVQEACDSTSMVAYRVVGHILDELAKIEGLELYEVDRLYLRSYASVLEDSEELSDTLLTSKFSGMWQNVLNH